MTRAVAVLALAGFLLAAPAWAQEVGAGKERLIACRAELVKVEQAVRTDMERSGPSKEVYLLGDVEHNCRMASMLLHNLIDIHLAADSPDAWKGFKTKKLDEFKEKAGFAMKDINRRRACLESCRPLSGEPEINVWLDKAENALTCAAGSLKALLDSADAGKADGK